VHIARPVRVALGLGLVGLAAAACAGSGYEFVQNDEHGVYARVPDDWAVYDNDEVLEALTGDESGGSDVLEPSVWSSGFDAGDDPSPERVIQPGADSPRGFVQIRRLNPQQRNQVNLSTLRGFVIGGDPLAANPLGGSGNRARVLEEEPVEFDGGYHGLHTVFAVPPASGDVVIIDQTALLDSTSSTLFLLVVSCDEDCYFETNHDEITDIVDSWTIEEDAS
jgi:hypothetical protein